MINEYFKELFNNIEIFALVQK
ncbi:hypothetical protein EZS27_034925 [termite gut metagenome]|uniref:Uncharacterized protein n=1 Tax=termite gut metagenome TaxID=433724 RepID=A0A5J4Q0E8_9ZZZZ